MLKKHVSRIQISASAAVAGALIYFGIRAFLTAGCFSIRTFPAVMLIWQDSAFSGGIGTYEKINCQAAGGHVYQPACPGHGGDAFRQ
jgi:hypothetical protein